MTVQRTCWCGNRRLVPFGATYWQCEDCATLVTRRPASATLARVDDDQSAFYGREYWLSHQLRDLKQPDIAQRARNDLPERCTYWLRTTVKYLLPPARILEVGSGPGAFVALLRWAGFDATGLELSPWVVDYSRRTFDIPVLAGPIEEQVIEQQSLDAIVMMDVLEHLTDPVGTMRRCLEVLKPEGVLIVQTPRLPHGKNYERLVADADPFLEMLKDDEHLCLFSDQSARRFFSESGVHEVVSEPAIFPYDMFLIASRSPLVTHDRAAIDAALQAQPRGRLTLALLDLDGRLRECESRLMESEADRAARLSAMEKLGAQLLESETDRAARLSSIEKLQAQLLESEADRAARLAAMNDLGLRLAATNEELNQARRELTQASNGELHTNG